MASRRNIWKHLRRCVYRKPSKLWASPRILATQRGRFLR
jgi:hypothetical protein